ncbi:dihydroorotase [Flavobacterium crassostreae]|uniref:Dihydroorotase n=1 Tax=Flavobacterium crassostreae TaxID=1763534 RepID=A0A1B9E2E9_9FLAO|nr:dihydroorotase [Flavobacterium crassostreae]OCB76107.1 dihydroorotase [Flavobacterium crassostreae]
MKFILREATIIDTQSPFHNKTVDILIADGFIKKIGPKLAKPENCDEIKLENLHVSTGWFDSSVSLGEPGYEERETIANGLQVAAKSGFTAIALQPNSFPVIDNQSQILFVKSKARQSATELFPIGALTKESKGEDMAELFDMKNAGAIAFGDYNKSIANANLLKIALQYVHDFDGLVIAYSQDEKIKGNGVANEGIVSTRLGLKGIPNLAEELQIARNLFLLEYTGGKLHIPTISTAKSVQLLREAKAKGLAVSCSVSVHHLVMTDEKLEEFDTRYKVSPPLRNDTDRKALLQGVLNGTIDMITSDHNPIDIEYKKMEFDAAKNGTIGLESAFGALMSVLPLETVIAKLTAGRNLFGIATTVIDEGQKANLTLFNPEGEKIFTKDSIGSKSKNSAFLGMPLKGKAYGIINQEQLILV